MFEATTKVEHLKVSFLLSSVQQHLNIDDGRYYLHYKWCSNSFCTHCSNCQHNHSVERNHLVFQLHQISQ